MRDFLQFLIENLIATAAAMVSLIVGIIEIAKFIKDSKGKNKKAIMVVVGFIFAIALSYLIFQYALVDRKDITTENSKPTEDIVTTESGLEVVPANVSSIMLSESVLYIQVGQLQPITATVLYSDNSKDSNVIWVSSDEAIATVDQNGMVVAHSIGEAEIIAQVSSGNVAKEASCKIVVGTEPTGYDISLSTNKVFLHETFQVYVTPFEENTKIIVYGQAPSGTVYEFEYSKDKKFFVETEIGIWTIYAKIKNEFGVYEAFKPEDFVTIEIAPWNFEN